MRLWLVLSCFMLISASPLSAYAQKGEPRIHIKTPEIVMPDIAATIDAALENIEMNLDFSGISEALDQLHELDFEGFRTQLETLRPEIEHEMRRELEIARTEIDLSEIRHQMEDFHLDWDEDELRESLEDMRYELEDMHIELEDALRFELGDIKIDRFDLDLDLDIDEDFEFDVDVEIDS
ncbi:MAG: hypothetical protein HOH43_10700 [Candidatus Latescibacteria bacterium]|nr:hypothetical protein [Candidatus Latescibacterota bacterium]